MYKKIISVILAVAIMSAMCLHLPVTASAAQVLTGGEQLALENSDLSLYVTPDSGLIRVIDKATGNEWLSNPVNPEDDKTAKNIFKTNLKSQVLIEYLEDGKLQQTNSFVGSVSENGLNVQLADGMLLLNYYFPEQQFNVPLILTLNGDKLSARVDYKNIKENGEMKLTKLSIMPYFAAGSSEADGYTLLPDGSGAVVNFNNGKFSQGSYKMYIYGKDITEVTERHIVSSKPCMLPVYAISHKDKGTVIAVATSGEAGGAIISAVSGKETSYNNTYFQFTVRYYHTTTLLDRTWASKDIIIASQTNRKDDRAEIEYSFSEKQDLVSIADSYRQYLIKAGLKKTEKKNTLYLDVYMGVKVKKQFLGFPYEAVDSLTTFDQLTEMLKTLKNAGIKDISVKLTGADSSGAYYGKIDGNVSFSSAVGGKSGYKKLLSENLATLYPNVNATEFTKNSLSYNSFLHSTVGVINKTAKLYDYKFSTKLRDYETPVRYLLKPEKVEKAVKAVNKSANKLKAEGLSFDTLASKLYSCYSGDIYEINETKDLFAELIKETAKDKKVMLSAANAYALPFATSVINLPVTASGHYIEDYSVPFIQMVLDGYVEYSTEPVNAFGNKSDIFLSAVESNSSLQFINMYETFDKVANTELSGLYSATFDYWKDDICDMYRQLSKIREYTENSEISGYKIINDDIREVSFENDTVIYINRSNTLFKYNGIEIPAENCYILEANK